MKYVQDAFKGVHGRWKTYTAYKCITKAFMTVIVFAGVTNAHKYACSTAFVMHYLVMIFTT